MWGFDLEYHGQPVADVHGPGVLRSRLGKHRAYHSLSLRGRVRVGAAEHPQQRGGSACSRSVRSRARRTFPSSTALGSRPNRSTIRSYSDRVRAISSRISWLTGMAHQGSADIPEYYHLPFPKGNADRQFPGPFCYSLSLRGRVRGGGEIPAGSKALKYGIASTELTEAIPLR